MKKLLSVFLTLCFLAGGAACGAEEVSGSSAEAGPPEHLGLYAAEDGTLMKDGKPFYGFGVNYYGLLNSSFGRDLKGGKEPFDVQASLDAMEVLASYDVRVIRFNLGVYLGQDWKYIVDSEEAYFAALDALADKAAELDRGLLPCFFWGAPSDYYGEPMGSCFRTDYSKSMRFIRSFTEKVVTRYASHPGFYGWEYSNEVNLNSDLPAGYLSYMQSPRPDGTPRTDDDLITTELYKNALNVFSETVAACDPYHRIVGNGDAEAREEAYHLSQGRGWVKDSRAEHEKQLDLLNEDMTAISIHRYPGGAPAVDAPKELGQYLDCYSDWPSFMEYMVSQSKRTGKPVYLGETGFVYSDAQERLSVGGIMSVIDEIIDSAIGAGMQLTLFWNYDPRSVFNPEDPTDCRTGGTEHSWNETWEKGKAILEAIKLGNEAFDEKYR